jgi:hypothetical protein
VRTNNWGAVFGTSMRQLSASRQGTSRGTAHQSLGSRKSALWRAFGCIAKTARKKRCCDTDAPYRLPKRRSGATDVRRISALLIAIWKTPRRSVPVVAVLTLEIIVEHSHSLKEKRHVVKSLKDRLRQRFNVAVAEIDGLDSWQRSLSQCRTAALTPSRCCRQ